MWLCVSGKMASDLAANLALADSMTVDFTIPGESLISNGGAYLLRPSLSFRMVKSCSKEQWNGFGHYARYVAPWSIAF